MKINKGYLKAVLFAILGLCFLPVHMASAGLVGVSFVGGSPETQGGGNPNSTEADVALITGLPATMLGSTGSTPNLNITSGLGTTTFEYDATGSGATHLTAKASGYWILFQILADTGSIMLDSMTWGIPTPGTAGTCLDGLGGTRACNLPDDFLNNGGQVADISNITGYKVVPIPAAIWLFGSSLGLLGLVRRKQRNDDIAGFAA